MSGPTLVCCDLDRTLIYSASALGAWDQTPVPALRCVEWLDGVPQSFMTEVAARLVAELAFGSVFVPTTTRTRGQYLRVRLPIPVPAYAIIANGGQLLVDGRLDQDWADAVQRRLAADSAPLEEIRDLLLASRDAAWLVRERAVEELFCYALIDRAALPGDVLVELRAWAAGLGWTVSVQGRKLYLVPRSLTKSAAAAEVARRIGASRLLAAGDALLDADLLEMADIALRPPHGELHETRWVTPGLIVTAADGVRGGEELLQALLDRS